MARRFCARSVVPGLLLLGIIGFSVWSRTGRRPPKSVSELRLQTVREYGYAGASGRLVAIQPYMFPKDYASQRIFEVKLDGYFRKAAEPGWLGRESIVVLPEYLGAWLVVAGEKKGVYTADTVTSAVALIAASNVPSFLRCAVRSPGTDRFTYAAFAMKGRRMAETYDSVLSGLARKYGVTIVGGSIVLPSPTVVNGHLVAGRGPLYNVCPVYRLDGSAESLLVTKVYLTGPEQEWQRPGKTADLPVFDTPVGRMGVLICADSWFPGPYRVLHRKGAHFVAGLSFITGDGKLDKPWDGYSGHDPPSDVAPADEKHLTLRQAWAKYAFAGRLADSGIPEGIMAHLRGDLWNLGSDGSTVVVVHGHATEVAGADGASIVSLCIPTDIDRKAE